MSHQIIFRLMEFKSTKLNFSGQSVFCGIDVHKNNWKISIMVEDYFHKTFAQDPKADILVNYLHHNFPGANYYAVYEAGFSGFKLCKELRQLGVNCIIAHPADIPTSDKERRNKCDVRDSKKLVRNLKNGQLSPIYIPDEQQLADRALVRLRATTSKELTRFKNRVKSLLMFNGIDIPSRFDNGSRYWSGEYISWLEELPLKEESLRKTLNALLKMGKSLRSDLLEITRDLRKLSKTNKYQQDVKLLLGIPGIGLVTAMCFLTEIGDTSRFATMDELRSYIGLIPNTDSSGEKEKVGRITRRGKNLLKSELIESSWIAVRRDPSLLLQFSELSKRMAKNKAIIRITRKLVSRIAFILRKKQEYIMGVA